MSDTQVMERRPIRSASTILQSLFANKIVVAVMIGVSLLMVAVALGFTLLDFESSGPALVYYSATNNDLPIVVTERGYLESQEQTTIQCRVESYDRNSGSSGSTILFIVPNGSVVEQGALLVELDSASIRDRLESEELEYQSDQSALLQAKARQKNQITQNETSTAEAQLALELAKLDREMYLDNDSGSFQLSVEEINRQIDDTRNVILEAQAALKLQETEKAGIEELFRLGYKGKSDLDQSRFSFMKSEAALAAAVNRLTNHESSRQQLETYEYKKELLRLNGAVNTAERNLAQVQVTNDSELAQVNAQLFEAQERVSRQKSRIAQHKRQLEFCTIYAPHAGMVVYASNEQSSRYGTTRIGEGASVRNRQDLIKLPDLSKMQIRTQVHEAVLDQIRPGLPVTVRVDAFPNRTYTGTISEVAVVPSENSNGSVKTYDCVVKIPEIVNQLKPGMTAVSEIHVDRLRNVVSVPVQAIVQNDDQSWVYVNDGGQVRRQDVELGRNNDQFVHIISGVDEGNRVVLNPMSIYKNEQSNLSISPDEGFSDAPADAPSAVMADQSEPAVDIPLEESGPSSGSRVVQEDRPPSSTESDDQTRNRNRKRNSKPIPPVESDTGV